MHPLLLPLMLAGPKAGNLVALTNGTITDDTSPFTLAKVRFNSDGSIDQYTDNVGIYTQFHPGEWYIPEPVTGVGNIYEIRLESWTGFTPSPSDFNWKGIDTNPEWSYTTSFSGQLRFTNMTMEIRKKNTTTVLATAIIRLEGDLR